MSKEEYRIFCQKEKDIPLFLTYDWMQTTGYSWNVVLYKSGDNIIGVLPYFLFRKKGFRIIDLPPLSVYGGVWMKYPSDQKNASKISYEKEVMTALIEGIEKFDQFGVKFLPGFNNWLPFYWHGFRQTTRYTYVLEDLNDHHKLFEGFNENIKRNIRKAEKTMRIVPSSDITLFCDLKQKFEKETGNDFKVNFDTIRNIHSFCLKNNCGEILLAMEGDVIQSAGLFVWDKNTCYYLYGITDPEFRKSAGMCLLLWEAIKRYSDRINSFNFEGSMIEGVENFFRSFGGRQVPYFYISKINSPFLKIRNLLKNF